jgi:hypothetical protein
MAQETPQLSIPRADVPRFRAVSNITLNDLETIKNALETTPPFLDSDLLAESLTKTTGMNPEVVSCVVHLGVLLAHVRRHIEIGIDAFMELVNDALAKATGWEPNEQSLWIERSGLVAQMLQPEGTIDICAKSGILLREQHATLGSARIITDARPVFNEDATCIRALVPVHTLILTVNEGREERVHHVAMDAWWLDELAKCIERARKKETQLREALAVCELPLVRTEGHPDE